MQRLTAFLIFSACFFLSEVNGNNGLKVDSANVRHPRGIYFAFGTSFSGIDVYKNYLHNPRRFGYNPRLYWEFSNTFRVAGGFSRISKFTFAPSWEQLGSYVAEADLHMMARIKDEHSIFYLITGLCYNSWKGHFRKQSAFYDAVASYQPNTIISQAWAGLNIGVGIERAFKHFELYAEYKYRFTKTYEAFGIADVCVNAGIKKKIPFRKIFRGVGDRYHWF